jgi:competence protein ComEA
MTLLLGLALALLGGRSLAYLGWGNNPSQREQEAVLTYRVDLNQAERAELLQLPGIGDALAQRIVDHRREQGAFRSVEELQQVHRIGPKTLERLRPWVYVSKEEGAEAEAKPPTVTAGAARPDGKGTPAAPDKVYGAKKLAKLSGPINVNQATAAELQALPGIGPKLSQRIVEERGKGPFQSVEDLRRVAGIGPITVERLRNLVTFATGPVQVPRIALSP